MKYGVLAVCVLAGCGTSLDVSLNTVVECTSDSDCPNGLVCVAGERCLEASAVDSDGTRLLLSAQDTTAAAR